MEGPGRCQGQIQLLTPENTETVITTARKTETDLSIFLAALGAVSFFACSPLSSTDVSSSLRGIPFLPCVPIFRLAVLRVARAFLSLASAVHRKGENVG